jgi:hypothetical protein
MLGRMEMNSPPRPNDGLMAQVEERAVYELSQPSLGNGERDGEQGPL